MRWILNIRAAVAVCAMAIAAVAWAVTPVNSLAELTPDRIGEFITITGKTGQFRAPSSRKEPYSFRLHDKTGKAIRVCAWPETMTSINNWHDLATTGTVIHLTAEVTDHDGEFELQILDGAEVQVDARRQPGGQTTASAAVTTAAGNVETTRTH